METWINSSVNNVKEAVTTLRDTVTNAPPGAKTLLLFAIPGTAAFSNGTIMETPLFIGLTSGLSALFLCGVGLGSYCLYKSCTKPVESWALIENEPGEEGELHEDTTTGLLFFHHEHDSSSVILSRQVTPQSSKPVSSDEGENSERDFQELLAKWKISDYVGSADSPFATDDESVNSFPANKLDIQGMQADRAANG